MRDASVELIGLQGMNADATLHSEGGKPFVHLPNTRFRSTGVARTMNLLLQPWGHDNNYTTRLYFDQKILGTTQNWLDKNWSQHTLLSRNWWTPSWKLVAADQPWTDILMAHLRSVA